MSGSASLTGSMGITGDLEVKGNISSSTISGIGNVTAYSQSISSSQNVQDIRLNKIEISTGSLNEFSASVTSSLVSIYQTTASLNQTTASLNAFTASLVITFVTTASLQATASFLQNQIDQKLFTSSFNSYTSSTNIRLNNLESTSASVNTSISNLNVTTASLNAKTGSYATTASNSFLGDQTITGSLTLSSSAAIELNVIGNSTFSGSIRGVVVPLSIVASTASMDCSLSNFFTLTLAGSGLNTRLVASNIEPGETITLRVTQNSTTGSLTYPSYIKFPNFGGYVPTPSANAVDILSFVTLDSTTLYGVNVKNMI
jgi:hypothetical protein